MPPGAFFRLAARLAPTTETRAPLLMKCGSGLRMEDALASRELFAAIATLPDDFRLALVAVDVVGLSYREAARALGTQEATIASRLHRGRDRVAQRLATDAPPLADAPRREGAGPRRSLR